MKKVLKIVPHALIPFCFLISCSLSPDNLSGKGMAYVISAGVDYVSSGVPALYGAPHDAEEIAACLYSLYCDRDIPVSVSLVLSPEASASRILDEVISCPAGENDLLVFYFSGHGSSDSRGFFLAGEASGEQILYSRLYAEDLIEEIRKKNCPALVILDACYSGAAGEENTYTCGISESLERLFEDVRDDPKMAVLSSSASDKLSYMTTVVNEDGNAEKHSLFTARVLETLGWVHSSSAGTSFPAFCSASGVTDIREHSGYLKAVKKSRITVLDVYKGALNRWTSERQIPVMNRTSVPVVLIP